MLSVGDLSLDYSNQQLDQNTLNVLLELANEVALGSHIKALFSGAVVNFSEKRPALHTALRAAGTDQIFVDNQNIMPAVLAAREDMRRLSESLRNGDYLGFSGKPIQDVVNIGIGGSHLGPLFCLDALSDYVTPSLGFHFISELDPRALNRTLSTLNPETTLFIVSSKSFGTQETLYNAEKAKAWLGKPAGWNRHFIAVTAQKEKAQAFGIEKVIPIWEWVGGRFSVCSAISLITCIAIGYANFSEFLDGARLMDQHYKESDFAHNMPVLLALFGLWNRNFLNIASLLVLVYAQDLQLFVPYLQQLDMESNGKSLDQKGQALEYGTGPIVWGGLGNQAQHSYYQLLCQGTHPIAVDLISLDVFNDEPINLLCEAQKTVLSQGSASETDPFAEVKGHIPLNHLRLKDATPKSLGMLIALYEHKIYTQAVIWGINPFDQPGVESSKKVLQRSLQGKACTFERAKS